jgi:hypothetical protein
MANESPENEVKSPVTDTIAEYEGAFENFVRERPLTALAISFVVGAFLARRIF